MRKIATLVISLILILLLVVAMFRGIKIGNIQISSLKQIKEKNDKVNDKIGEASMVTSVEYESKVKSLEETYDEYNLQKKTYKEVMGFTEDDKKGVYETKQYDIGYLWGEVGKYATEQNLKLMMDVKKTSESGLYDLYFTVSGEYVNISEFIKDIEDNSDLYFRIYNFKMIGNTDVVTSSFTVRNVSLDSSAITVTNVQELNDAIGDETENNTENNTENINQE